MPRSTDKFQFFPRWASSVLSLEIRKHLSYRVDFWVDFLGTLVAHLGVAYFLWKAIFSYRNIGELGGYSFHAMMLYYLLVPMVIKTIRGQEMGFISADIYEGTLNRYLIYPVSFFKFKFIAHLALSLLSILQLILALGVFLFIFGIPEDINLTLINFILGVFAMLLASYLYFSIASILEQVSFWVDNVWSLLVMLRFSIAFLGGAFIPLALFPDWAQNLMAFLPFSYLLSFPIQIILGKIDFQHYLLGLFAIICWSIFFDLIKNWVWKKGNLQYSGVGI